MSKKASSTLPSYAGADGSAELGQELAFEAVHKTNISDEIANQLIASILDGRLKFGDKLPAERELATHFHSSRPSVREALRTLSIVGLIDIRQGEGAFVVDEHAEFVAKAFSWVVLLDPATTQEIIEARTAIEGTLARLAAQRRTAEEIDELDGFIHSMRDAQSAQGLDLQRFADADLGFHMAVARISRNKALSRTLTAIRSLLAAWIERALTVQATAAQATGQHQFIRDAIAGSDPEAAEKAMREHLEAMAARIPEAPE